MEIVGTEQLMQLVLAKTLIGQSKGAFTENYLTSSTGGIDLHVAFQPAPFKMLEESMMANSFS
jgi:hypothetical protein